MNGGGKTKTGFLFLVPEALIDREHIVWGDLATEEYTFNVLITILFNACCLSWGGVNVVCLSLSLLSVSICCVPYLNALPHIGRLEGNILIVIL